jgi:hypothetical protein
MELIGPSVRLTTHCYVVTRSKLGVDVMYSSYVHFWRLQGQLYLHLLVVYLKTSSVASENYIASNRVCFDREIQKGMEEIITAICGFFWND